MSSLYLDCPMGAAGDLLTGALLQLTGDRDKYIKELNSMGIPGVEFDYYEKQIDLFVGTRMRVLLGECKEEETPDNFDRFGEKTAKSTINSETGTQFGEKTAKSTKILHSTQNNAENPHNSQENDENHHEHRSFSEVLAIIEQLSVENTVKNDIIAVYKLLAEAESQAHGVKISEIHFHEVGMLDAIADISAVCYLMSVLSPDKIISSAINVGSGTVKCAHGILDVPVPATAALLEGIPYYSSSVETELCTPTGAALLKYWVCEFLPVGEAIVIPNLQRVGYGMGYKEFDEAPNCVKAMLVSQGSGRYREKFYPQSKK